LGILRYALAVAKSSAPVLILGETGTGKELMARALHCHSATKGPFVAENISGIPETLLQDTLFGHVLGAFSGAEQNRQGLISQAGKGTLFLDEIGDLKPETQIKLLRLLQEKVYYPLGSDQPVTSECRFIFATHQNLEQKMESGEFRRDLYYRIQTHRIQLPPLKDRKEDILPLAQTFAMRSAKQISKPAPTITKELAFYLKHKEFPGNIRELEAFLHNLVLTQNSEDLYPPDDFGLCGLPKFVACEEESSQLLELFKNRSVASLKDLEDQLIDQALDYFQGNQTAAAALLGLTREALNKRVLRRSRKLVT
jgi:DNA-binding NtrC family response regulator